MMAQKYCGSIICIASSPRLELLREMVPAATRVAVLVSPSNAATYESTVRDTAAAARAMGLQVQVLNADTSREIDAAFAALARERSDALFVDPNPFFVSRRANWSTSHRASRSRRFIWIARLPKS